MVTLDLLLPEFWLVIGREVLPTIFPAKMSVMDQNKFIQNWFAFGNTLPTFELILSSDIFASNSDFMSKEEAGGGLLCELWSLVLVEFHL